MQGKAALAVFLVVVLAAASPSAFFMPGPWYVALNKPWWTPPGWVFPVAWTVLYTMIAIAGWLAWRAGGWSAAILIWGLGLILNGLWFYLMFGRQDITAALIDIAALWFATGAFVFVAFPLDLGASTLFAIYWLWVSFAGALNFAIWRMNG